MPPTTTHDFLCKYYLAGVCRNGTKCAFSHDKDAQLNQVCKYYLAGNCTYGDNCRYEHIRPAWAKPEEQPRGYVPPPQPRPVVDNLADQLPISYLRLSGRAPNNRPSNTSSEPHSGGPPVDLPKDPFATGSATDDDGDGEYEYALSAGMAMAPYKESTGYQKVGPSHCHGGFDGRKAGPSHKEKEEKDTHAWALPVLEDAQGAWPMPPGIPGLCGEYYARGSCSKGVLCPLAHGEYCRLCERYALHPKDESLRAQHIDECTARQDRLEARARSSHVECGICLEKVMEKANPGDRKFGLLACEHSFCLGCIRAWRSKMDGGADIDSAVRTCPICRTTTYVVTPSSTWPSTQEEKAAVIEGYKSKLADTPCKYFRMGEGSCPFGTSCFYKHMYPDGRLEEKDLRKVAADEGDVRVLDQVRLSDFITITRTRRRR